MIAWLQIVISNVAVAILVGGLAWLVGRSGRRATLANALWVIFFIKLITPPLIWVPIAIPVAWLPATVAETTQIPSQIPSHTASISAAQPSSTELWHPRESDQTPAAAAEAVAPEAVVPSRIMAIDLWAWIAVVWLSGSVWMLARGLIRFIRFRRLLLREGERDPDAALFVNQLLQSAQEGRIFRTGPRWCPNILRLPVRVSPMLFGFGRRAVIVCPDQLWQSLSVDERQSLLAHEAAHYFRRDHWVRWLEWFVTALYWWFPGVYVARRELERHEEAACDAWAVRKLQTTPRQYAEALLRVVDFLSEHRVGIPRLASGMQPTDSLEQRLRLLMRPSEPSPTSRPVQWTASAACLSLWIVHPWLNSHSPTHRAVVLSPAAVSQAMGTTRRPDAGLTLAPASTGPELPEPPRGFWNQRSRRQWANFSLTLPGARLIAEAGRGIAIERPERQQLRFSPAQLSAIVEIPSTRRVVIGDASGRLRLWDLQAGSPTSLIGRHGAAVTSLAYHESFGIVSADAAGSVTRWDLQSGQVLATWSKSMAPVQSVRCSGDGRTMAILVGSWSELDTAHEVYFVDVFSLETHRSRSVSSSTAVIMQAESAEWVAVEWSGLVRLLNTGQPIAKIAKHDVSALVLSQDAARTLPENL